MATYSIEERGEYMELEQVKQRKRQIEEDLTKRNEDLNVLKKEKASLEADLNVKREGIATAEQAIFDKREELRKLEIALEVMER